MVIAAASAAKEPENGVGLKHNVDNRTVSGGFDFDGNHVGVHVDYMFCRSCGHIFRSGSGTNLTIASLLLLDSPLR